MIKTAAELAKACEDVAKNYKTLYVMGCFGSPLTGANVSRYCNNHTYNKQAHRTAMIKARANQNPPFFGFDCVCLIKGLLWGWSGDQAKTYGGATYASNGVPDIDANRMIRECSDVSTDFSNIQIGEVVWMQDHIGVYIGNGLAVECTPSWGNGVQITSCNTSKKGIHRRNWTKHGKLPYVEYSVESVEKSETIKNTESEVCIVEVKQLKKGSKGESVKALQRMLWAMGYELGNNNPIDGDFGSKTDGAVRAYQKKNGLTVDGVVGPKTWAKLLGV